MNKGGTTVFAITLWRRSVTSKNFGRRSVTSRRFGSKCYFEGGWREVLLRGDMARSVTSRGFGSKCYFEGIGVDVLLRGEDVEMLLRQNMKNTSISNSDYVNICLQW